MYSSSQVPQRRHKSSRRDLYKINGFHVSTWGKESTRVIDQSRSFSEELIGHRKHKEERDLKVKGFFYREEARKHTQET